MESCRYVLPRRPPSSQLTVKGAELQGGEQDVKFGQVGTQAGFLLFDGFDDGGEAALEVEGRERHSQLLNIAITDNGLSSLSACVLSGIILTLKRKPTLNAKDISQDNHLPALWIVVMGSPTDMKGVGQL